MDKNEARKSICLIANNLKLLKMKKIIITVSGLILAASLFVGINTYKNSHSVSDLLLANVEALADGESGSGCHYVNGYKSFSGRSGGAYDCCGVWRDQRPDSGNCS